MKKNSDLNTIKRLKKEIPIVAKRDKETSKSIRIQKLKDRGIIPQNDGVDLLELCSIFKLIKKLKGEKN
jgi:hypothetical protein